MVEGEHNEPPADHSRESGHEPNRSGVSVRESYFKTAMLLSIKSPHLVVAAAVAHLEHEEQAILIHVSRGEKQGPKRG